MVIWAMPAALPYPADNDTIYAYMRIMSQPTSSLLKGIPDGMR